MSRALRSGVLLAVTAALGLAVWVTARGGGRAVVPRPLADAGAAEQGGAVTARAPAPPASGAPADDAAASGSTTRPPAPAGARSPAAEERLMARLRLEVDARPALALELAREAERRFPHGRLADERAWLAMRALVHLNRIAEARDEAAAFFERYPGSTYAERVYRLTGVHPRPRPGPRR